MKYDLVVIGYRNGERIGEIRDYQSEVWADKWMNRVANGHTVDNNRPIAVKYRIENGLLEPKKVLATDARVSSKDQDIISELEENGDVEVEYL